MARVTLGPVAALERALASYVKSNGRRLLSLASALGQDRVAIHVRALFRHHDPTTGYAKLEEALSNMAEGDRSALESQGVRLEERRGELYVVVDVDTIRRLLG